MVFLAELCLETTKFFAPTFWNNLTDRAVQRTDSSFIVKGFMQFNYLLTILPFTISCTSACARPKMLTAEQLYVPESFPRTFLRSNFPPDITDRLDCLFVLLHTMIGSGLPITEHWNEADPPSLTVSVLGNTATGVQVYSSGAPSVRKLVNYPSEKIWL